MNDGNYTIKKEFKDRLGKKHTLCMIGSSKTYKGKSYRNRKPCEGCGDTDTVAFCLECNKVLCYPFRLPSNMEVNLKDGIRNGSCFMMHVKGECRTSVRLKLKNAPCKIEEV